MLEFFGSDEKLDKAGIHMKIQDSSEFEQVRPMSTVIIIILNLYSWLFVL